MSGMLAAPACGVRPPFSLLLDAPPPVERMAGRCVEVVILVSVYGGKLSSIRESIMRAMCWKPDVDGWGLLCVVIRTMYFSIAILYTLYK